MCMLAAAFDGAAPANANQGDIWGFRTFRLA
jgi:hypothetical protein